MTINTENIICSLSGQQYRAAQACIAKKDVRPYLNGIHINSEHVVSTDGSILYCAKIDPGEDFTCSIIFEPARLPTYTEKVVIYAHDGYNVLVVSYGRDKKIKEQSVCKLIDGKFPDYKRIIPDTNRFKEQFCDFSLDADYLARLKTIFGKYPLRFDVSSPSDPVVITHATKPEFGTCVLMPCRLK